MCDTWWTGVTQIVTLQDGDYTIVKGLKPLKADPDMVQLAKPAVVPEGWSDLAVQALATLWTVIRIPNGNPLWVRLADGTTHYEPPFVVESTLETMTEDQVRMCLKTKDPMVLIEDDAEDDALYRAAAASTNGSEEPDTSRSEEHDASSSEENGSSSSEEPPDDMQTPQEIMDTSTTTVTTLSEDSEEFYDCWSAVAQPAHVLPTTKKTKTTKKPTPKAQAQKPDLFLPISLPLMTM
eukprot:5996552-Amphidinium_carterae.1